MKKLFLIIFSIALLFVNSSCYANTNDETTIYNKKMDKIELLIKQKQYSKALKESNKLLKKTADEKEKKILNEKITFISHKNLQQKELDKFWLRHDKYKKISWYEANEYFKRPIKLRIVQDDISGALFMQIHFVIFYETTNWMYIDEICLYSDGETKDYSPSVGVRNVHCPSVSYCNFEENLWFNLDENGLNTFQKMINGNNVSIRANGVQRYLDFNILPANKKIINQTIEIYKLLKNKEINQSDFRLQTY